MFLLPSKNRPQRDQVDQVSYYEKTLYLSVG
jgi:hypothetical protein